MNKQPIPKYLPYIQAMFKKHGEDYDTIQGRFYVLNQGDSILFSSLAVYSHFYYYICTPDEKDSREELKIVGVTSLIEALMADIDFKTFFEYFESNHKGQNSIADYKDLKKKYLADYGANKKIISYFKQYIDANDVKTILKNIKVWSKNKKDFIALNTLDQLAKLLYQMRSDFVHKAEMRNFLPSAQHATISLSKVGKDYYAFKVNLTKILQLFEKSFVNYWKQKYEALPN